MAISHAINFNSRDYGKDTINWHDAKKLWTKLKYSEKDKDRIYNLPYIFFQNKALCAN